MEKELDVVHILNKLREVRLIVKSQAQSNLANLMILKTHHKNVLDIDSEEE